MSGKPLEILVQVTCTAEGMPVGQPEVIGPHDYLEELQRWDRDKVETFGMMGAAGVDTITFSDGDREERYKKIEEGTTTLPETDLNYKKKIITYRRCEESLDCD